MNYEIFDHYGGKMKHSAQMDWADESSVSKVWHSDIRLSCVYLYANKNPHLMADARALKWSVAFHGERNYIYMLHDVQYA